MPYIIVFVVSLFGGNTEASFMYVTYSASLNLLIYIGSLTVKAGARQYIYRVLWHLNAGRKEDKRKEEVGINHKRRRHTWINLQPSY